MVLPMTNCKPNTLQFPPLKRRKIQAEFSGGDIIPILIKKYYKEAHFLVPIDRTNSG